MTKHLFIPDVQAKDGVPLKHLEALGNDTVEKKPDVINCIGESIIAACDIKEEE